MSAATEEADAAAYEKQYGLLKTTAQPKYSHIDLQFDFHPRERREVGQTGNQNIALLNSNTTLSQLIDGLNALGVRPQEMADIIRTMSAAGAIHAELVVQ